MYGDTPLKNDLSHIKDYQEFIKAINYCLSKQYASLKVGGRMAILMADVKKNHKLYSMLLDMNKLGTVVLCQYFGHKKSNFFMLHF